MTAFMNGLVAAWQGAVRATLRIGGELGRWAAAQSWRRLLVLAILALIAQSVITENILHWNQDDEGGSSHSLSHKVRKQVHVTGSKDDEIDADVKINENGIFITRRHPAAAAAAAPAPGTPATPAPAAGTPATPGTSGTSGTSASGGSATTPDAHPADAHPADAHPADAHPADAHPADAHPADAHPALADKADAQDDETDSADDGDTETVVDFPHRGVRRWLKDAVEGLVLLLIVYLIAAKVVVRQTAKSDARAAAAEQSAADAAAAAEREALQRQLAQAQLQALQAQVEPHFLFNTLASVDYLIETDPARASAMQKNLIQYLRAALPQMRGQSSQLGREGDLSRAYLEILKMRMEDRLQVVVDIPEGLRSADFPPMMLQSLVENAIQHGVEPKPEGGEIRVGARVVDGRLEVSVSDTGVGIATGATNPTAGGGVGLSNVRERLVRLYGGEAAFRLEPGPQGGAVATIRLPYRVTSGPADGSAARAAGMAA